MQGRPFWQICLAIWFFLWGLLAVTNFQFALSNVVLGVLAIAIAVLWAFGK